MLESPYRLPMSNLQKEAVLAELRKHFGEVTPFAKGTSLFRIGNEAARIYFRYSKVHERSRAFFGLRELDLRLLDGHNSYICFLTDGTLPPVFLPFADFDDVFLQASPAADGQYKVQLIEAAGQLYLYIPTLGRFSVDAYVGTATVRERTSADLLRQDSNFSHVQIQTLLAGIGHLKGLDVYIPPVDQPRLDWTMTQSFRIEQALPGNVRDLASEIDVIWLVPGRSQLHSLFEVEHTTTIYSGLLRLNDVLLAETPHLKFAIVADNTRRSLFVRQAMRPTFKKSGLADLVSFLEYRNVYDWHARLAGKSSAASAI